MWGSVAVAARKRRVKSDSAVGASFFASAWMRSSAPSLAGAPEADGDGEADAPGDTALAAAAGGDEAPPQPAATQLATAIAAAMPATLVTLATLTTAERGLTAAAPCRG